MTTGLFSCLAACPFTSPHFSRAPSTQICRLGRAAAYNSALGLLLMQHASRCSDLQVQVCGRATGKTLYAECAEMLEAGGQKQVLDECGGSRSGLSRDEEVLRVQDLRIGGVYKGKVSVVESYGAFVDIGAHVDGFVHISRLISARSSHVLQLTKRRSSSVEVESVVQVGQDVVVQIVDLDPCADIISLQLIVAEEVVDPMSRLQPLALSEQEILNRAASKRASKIARCSQVLSMRRVMSLETRQRLKARTRAVLAERQAFQLRQVRSRTSLSSKPGELGEGCDA